MNSVAGEDEAEFDDSTYYILHTSLCFLPFLCNEIACLEPMKGPQEYRRLDSASNINTWDCS